MEVFRDFFDRLKDLLTDDNLRLQVTSLLFSKELITAEQRDNCTISRNGATPSEKSVQLLRSIETTLKVDSDHMQTFIDVLREKIAIPTTLLDQIQSAYDRQHNDLPKPKIPRIDPESCELTGSGHSLPSVGVSDDKDLESSEPTAESDGSSLPSEGATEDCKMKLHGLKTHFASMTRRVVETLQALDINPLSIKIYVKELLKPNHTLHQELLATLAEASSLPEVFDKLSSTNLWDYWNYQVFADIVIEFGDDNAERMLTEYTAAYIRINKELGLKPTVIVINNDESLAPFPPKNLTRLELKLNPSWYSRTLMAAKSLAVSVLSGVKRLFFSGGRLNCVIVEFRVIWSRDQPSFLPETLDDDSCNLLQMEDVLSLSIDGKVVFSRSKDPDDFEASHLEIFDTVPQLYAEIGQLSLFPVKSRVIHPDNLSKLETFLSAKSRSTLHLCISNMFILSIQRHQIAISEVMDVSLSHLKANSKLVQDTTNVVITLLLTTLLPLLTNLRKLFIFNLPFGNTQEAKMLIGALKDRAQVSTLQLVEAGLSVEDVSVLSSVLPSLIQLSVLNLSQNNLPPSAIAELVKCLPTSLKMLYLSSNKFKTDENFGTDAAQSLSEFMNKSSLSDLFLTNCDINDEHIQLLRDSLLASSSLKTLSICNNPITDVGAQALAEVIQRSNSLQMLNLWNTEFSPVGLQAIVASMSLSQCLTCVTLPLRLKSSCEIFDNRINWV